MLVPGTYLYVQVTPLHQNPFGVESLIQIRRLNLLQTTTSSHVNWKLVNLLLPVAATHLIPAIVSSAITLLWNFIGGYSMRVYYSYYYNNIN